MATVKFKEPSPYKTPRLKPPTDDYHYASYEEKKSCDLTEQGVKKNEEIGVAICGCGRAGAIHLNNLTTNPRVKILYIVDDFESKWEELKTFWNLNNTRFLHSIDSQMIFDDPRVKALVVASPTYTHEKFVQEGLRAGKAIFCEKPIAGDMESTRRCYELAEKVGQPLLCAFNRRFDPSYNYVRQQVREGKVGHVHTIKTCSRDSPLPTIEYLKTSGIIFHDCAVHDVDIVCWTLGELPSRVFTVANANIPEIKEIGDYDTVAIVMDFPSGSVAMIDISRRSVYGYDQRLEVFGPRGMVTCQNERPMPGVEMNYGLEGLNKPPIWYSFPSRFKQSYINEMEHFLDIIEGKAKVSIHAREVLAVTKIAAALHESAKTGKPVDLVWSPKEMSQITNE